jgi:hypothetical protein
VHPLLLLCSLQNRIKEKDRELDAEKKEVTTLKSSLSSCQRCVQCTRSVLRHQLLLSA